MGEVMALTGGERGMMDEAEEEQSKKQQQQQKKDDDGGGSAEVVRWERFLPRMVLRVLLVEADDSTRQIIAALLRKCGYRVAAVCDGLKAWETLKRKAPDIDLILTEVELPSISGIALLTLIMEHDICKNIPVIMMSSRDSVSMVFKCMFKGAADFLIKPVRRNELRNLWQHVWRRHAISKPPQNLTFPQKIFEAASENNAASNQSSGSVASTLEIIECGKKVSQAQSTCTSPIWEAGSACMENMQGTSQLKSSLNLSNIDTMNHEESPKFEREPAKHKDETGEKSITFVTKAASCNKTFKSTDLRLDQGHGCAETDNQNEVLIAEQSKENPNISTEIYRCSDELVEHYRGAIDLFATFENLPKNTDENCVLNGGNTTKFEIDTQLELSLRRDFPGSSCKQAAKERQRLNHSNASAFSWYSGSKSMQPLFPRPKFAAAKVNNTDLDSHESHKLTGIGYTVDKCCKYPGTNQNQENMTTQVIGQSGLVRSKLPNNQCGLFPVTVITSDHRSRRINNDFPSVFYAPSGVHPIWTPKQFSQKESSPFPTSTSSQSNAETHNSEQLHHWSDDSTYTSLDQNVHDKSNLDHVMDDSTYTSLDQNVHDKSNLDHVRHDSPAAGESGGSSLCHDARSHINGRAYGSMGNGSDGNATLNLESSSDSGLHNYDGFKGTNSYRSSQREAALTKFRQKRKDRCYEKKVQYQSRKILAEQRRRVKGQFVRQSTD